MIWNEWVALVGTALRPRVVSAGEEVAPTACWQALEYVNKNLAVAAHIVDTSFRSLGQQDTFTGLGTYPSSYWEPGDIFCDDYRIPIDGSITEPEQGRASLVLYVGHPRNRLPVRLADGGLQDFALVEELKLVPVGGPPQTEEGAVPLAAFEQGIALLAYDWSKDTIQPGEAVTVTLRWLASGTPDQDCTVFALLLNNQGLLLVQDDSQSQDGYYPTRFWSSRELIVEERSFIVPVDATPGSTSLRLGFYLLTDGRRLRRTDSAELTDAAVATGPGVVP